MAQHIVVIDLSKELPYREMHEVFKLMTNLEAIGTQKLDREYTDKTKQDKIFEAESLLRKLNADLSKVNSEEISEEFKYGSIRLTIYQSKEHSDVVALFEHHSGPFYLVRTDRSSLTVCGDVKEHVDSYVASFYKAVGLENKVKSSQ